MLGELRVLRKLEERKMWPSLTERAHLTYLRAPSSARPLQPAASHSFAPARRATRRTAFRLKELPFLPVFWEP